MEMTEEPAMTAGEESDVKFTTVDYTLFSLMLVASISIGVISAIRDRNKVTPQEYLLGGRNMSPAPVTLSLLGGWISAISILGNPTEVYFSGTQLATVLLGCIPGCLVLGIVILPIFYNLNLVSINEYIELRYRSRLLRLLATLCLLLNNFLYMGMCLYAPTVALTTVTGLTTWQSTLIMGFICTFYITIGGVKAVVYTDVLQTLLMFVGVLLVVIVCCVDLGGIGNVWAIADRGGRIQFFNFSTSMYERHTIWSTAMFGFFIIINGVGFNQTTWQRFASVRTLQISQRMVISFLVGLCALWIVFYFSGLVAYATYSECDPFASGKIDKLDQIIPFLVTDKLNHLTGLAGIFVAAVYGGVLSTLSSCGNSVACIIWEDFLKERPYFSSLSDASATNVVKLLSVVAGVIAVGLGLLVEKLGSIYNVSNSILSAVAGPFAGIFFTGICAPWVNAKGSMVGFVLAFFFNVWVVVGKFVRGGGKVPRLPLSTKGCPGNLANATLCSLLTNTTEVLPFNTPVTDAVLFNTTEINVGLCNTTLADAVMSNTTMTALLSNSTIVQESVPTNHLTLFFCPANITLITTRSGEQELRDTLVFLLSRSSTKTMYDVSYCYSGVIGIVLMFIISTLVSLCTGPNSPEDVGEGLVYPPCARIYKRVWECVKGRPTYTVTQDTIKEDEAFKMFPRHNTYNLITSP